MAARGCPQWGRRKTPRGAGAEVSCTKNFSQTAGAREILWEGGDNRFVKNRVSAEMRLGSDQTSTEPSTDQMLSIGKGQLNPTQSREVISSIWKFTDQLSRERTSIRRFHKASYHVPYFDQPSWGIECSLGRKRLDTAVYPAVLCLSCARAVPEGYKTNNLKLRTRQGKNFSQSHRERRKRC